MADKEYKLKVTLQGDAAGGEVVQKKLDQLNREAEEAEKVSKKLRQEVAKLGKENKQLVRSLTKEADRLDVVAKKARETEEVYRKHGATAGRVVEQNRKLKGANSNAALGFLEITRAVEDAQYGLRGVVNNIPQIVALLGGGAGLAGVASLAAVALSQLWSRMSEGDKPIKDLSGALEDLKDGALEEYQVALSDQAANKAFQTGVEADASALAKFESKLDAVVAKRKALRDARTAEEIQQLDLEIARVEAGGGSDSEKFKQVSALQRRKTILRGESQQADLRDQISAAEDKRSAAVLRSTEILAELRALQSDLPNERFINGKSAQADSLEAKIETRLKGFTSEVENIGQTLLRGLDLSNITNPERSTFTATVQKDFKEAIQAFKKATDDKDDQGQEAALKAIADIGRRINDQGAKPGKDGVLLPIEENIRKQATDAQQVLVFLEAQGRLRREAAELEEKRTKDLEKAKSLRNEFNQLTGETGDIAGFASARELLQIQLDSLSKRQGTGLQIDEVGSKAELTKIVKREERERLKADRDYRQGVEKREGALKGVGIKLGDFSEDNLETEGVNAAGRKVMQVLVKAFADGVLDGGERSAVTQIQQQLAAKEAATLSKLGLRLRDLLNKYDQLDRELQTYKQQNRNRN